MYLSITHRGDAATELGHLLHKHPARLHESSLGYDLTLEALGEAHPEHGAPSQMASFAPRI